MQNAFRKLSPINCILCLFISVLFLGGCNLVQSDNEEETECYTSRIQFNPFDSLVYRTISGGRVYSLRQERTIDEETQITASFQFNYQQDDIRVVDQMETVSVYPYLRVTRDSELRPTEVIRYFSGSGVLLFQEITYPDDSSIRIDLTREASTGDVLYVGYADYQLNDNGNVVRLQHYRADTENPEQFTIMLDRFYSYDNNPNPQDNLYLPFFAGTSYPEPAFFSANNILSYSENGQNFEYRYGYGANGIVLRQTQPEGNEIFFSYSNCSTE